MEIRYTPFSEEVRADPYPFYATLRQQAPVYFVEDIGAWAVARYDDVRFVLSRPDLFSSDAMRTMFISSRLGPDAAADPETAERLFAIASALPFTPEEMVQARNLISTDPTQLQWRGALGFLGYSVVALVTTAGPAWLLWKRRATAA